VSRVTKHWLGQFDPLLLLLLSLVSKPQTTVVMRLSCVVEVSNRLAPSLNIRASKGSSKSQLALGLKPATIDKTVYIMLSTAQNSSGTFYKVSNIP